MQGAVAEMGNRTGRKRKQGPREPSGRNQREPEYSPVEVRRLRDAAMTGLRDEQWGTELGRYYLFQSITHGMYAAGKWWARLAERYQQAVAVPGQKPLVLERGSRSSPPDPESQAGVAQTERDLETEEEFKDALKALTDAGPVALRVVRNLCEQDQGPDGYHEFLNLRIGLLKLAEWRDLTNRPKSPNVRYAG